MRNSDFLDNPRPEDELIGEPFIDDEGNLCRMVAGKKRIQSADADHNLISNRVYASGLTPSQYLKMLFGTRKPAL